MVLKVVVAGAGPTGLLLALLLLQQNEENKENNTDDAPLYQVILLDSRENLADLPDDQLRRNSRSWMIGLSAHGLGAIRQIPLLWDNYVEQMTIRISSAVVFLAGFRIEKKVDSYVAAQEPYSIDRNFMVAALQRCMQDRHSSDANLTTLYETKLLYVDAERHQILTRSSVNNKNPTESYLDYDLLIGADGVRSVVREALVKNHVDFDLDIRDTFSKFKSVRVKRPVPLGPTQGLVTMFCGMRVYGAPMQDEWLGLMFSCSRHLLHKLPPELMSRDPQVVAEFVRQHWNAIPLEDYNDIGKQWVNSPWNHNTQVHCNSYHSVTCKIAIMGDAAHGTSPSIAMGMNTALRDAQALARLLKDHRGDLDAVLPAYSLERVKEGNALTEIALHVSCRSPWHHMTYVLGFVIRSTASKWLPFVPVPPELSLSSPACTLSEVYDKMSRMGILTKHRAINERLRREYFEIQTGMVAPPNPSSTSSVWWVGVVGMGAASCVLGFLITLLCKDF